MSVVTTRHLYKPHMLVATQKSTGIPVNDFTASLKRDNKKNVI